MDHIGISLSGGGLRAAAFGMGALSYLHHLRYQGAPLLHRVRYASSTSGGSVVLAYHAVRSYAGMPFNEAFRAFHADVAGTALLQEATRLLGDDATWERDFPHKTRNLINAFAIVYHRRLLDSADLGRLLDGPKPGAPPTIGEFCFNSTELQTGRAFRWKVQAGSDAPHEPGNDTLRYTEQAGPALRRIRLGDVVAASACFPGGFEPVVFPDDFEPGNGELTEAIYRKGDGERSAVRFGLMDGGIVDNQGLHGLKLEADKCDPPFSLLLLCDVSGPSIRPFVARAERPSWVRGLRVKHVLAVFVLGALGLIGGVVAAAGSGAWGAAVAVALGAGLCVLAISLAVRALAGSRKDRPEGPQEPTAWSVAWKGFGKPTLFNLRLGVLRNLIDTRLRAVGLLVGDLFMKEIRRRHYDDLFGDRDHLHKRSACLVHELTGANEAMRRKRLPDHPVSEVMQAVAEKAARMETTLWFADADNGMLDALLVSGQATMCWCLLAHLHERRRDGAPNLPGQEELRLALEEDWRRFNAGPAWLLERTMAAGRQEPQHGAPLAG